MKKLLLSAAALAFCTVGFAQNNDSDVDQRGTLNTSGVLQVGGNNTSVVDQEVETTRLVEILTVLL